MNNTKINYSYIDIVPIGGALYEVPLSVHLWDFYSNPVSDSTNVYICIEGIGEPFSGDSSYLLNDTIKWGGFSPFEFFNNINIEQNYGAVWIENQLQALGQRSFKMN